MARRRAIGAKLQEARDQAGLSRTEAAAIAGVSPHTWERWEFGQTAIPLERVADIVRAIGVMVLVNIEPHLQAA